MLAFVGKSEHFGGVLNRAPVMPDCDHPLLYLIWRIRPWKPLHPVLNPVWCSVTGIGKSKKSAVTVVPGSQRAGWEECACSHRSVVTVLDMYLEAHTHFEGISDGSKRKNTELCTFYCFLSKWFWTKKMKMKKYSSHYWSLVLYQHCTMSVLSVEVKCLCKASAWKVMIPICHLQICLWIICLYLLCKYICIL